MKFAVDDLRNVKKVRAVFNWTKLNLDWQGKVHVVHYVFHYPNQFFLLKHEFFEMFKFFLVRGGKYELNIVKLEILKQRNSRNRKCSKDLENYDDTIVDKVVHETGCRPPYIQSHKTYPQCQIQNDINKSRIDTLARERIGIPKACERISEVRIDLKYLVPRQNRPPFKTWEIIIDYPEEVKIITQSQDVDVHSLIGNIGGYLGLFLGKWIF